VALLLKAHPEFGRCGVEGHTDDTGPPDWNQKLSVMRASSVIEFLAGKGVDRKRLVPIGHGESLPWASNKTEEGRAQNRRVLFHIEGVDIEGQQKDRMRAERRRLIQINKRRSKPEQGGGDTPAAPDKSVERAGEKVEKKPEEKGQDKAEKSEAAPRHDEKSTASQKAKPEEKGKLEEKARPSDGPKPEDRSRTPGTKPGASDKVKTDDKGKPLPSAGKPKAAGDEETPESAAPSNEDASSSPGAPTSKRLRRPRGAAHNKPEGTEEPEPSTLKDLLKLPER